MQNLRILLGPPGEPKNSLLESAYRAARTNSGGDCWWMVGDPHQAQQVLGRLCADTGALLAHGVRPLPQAAEAVTAAAPEPVRPISSVQRTVLLEEILERGRHSGRLPLVSNAAASPGGIDYVAAAVAQLAHANLDVEELLDRADAERDQRVLQLTRVYQDYCRELARHNLMDREARLRFACELCETGQSSLVADLRLVVVSGIDSPTPLELRFLKAVLASAGEGIVALSIFSPDALSENDPAATPAPSVCPADTLRQLTAKFGAGETVWVDPQQPDDDPRRAAALQLFQDPRGQRLVSVAKDQQQLIVRGADGVQQEVDAAARHVKHLLQAGAAPEDVVVTARNITQLRSRLEEAFAAVGVPLAVEGSQPVGRAPLAQAAAQLLRLAADDWRYNDLLGLLTSPLLGLFDARLTADELNVCGRVGFSSRRAASEWLLRELLIPKGRRALLQRAQWLADEWQRHTDPANEESTLDRGRERLSAAAWLSISTLKQLDELTEPFVHEAAPLAWHDRLMQALGVLGYQSPRDSGRATLDHAAVDALEESFASLGHLNAWTSRDAPKLALREVERLVRSWLPRVRLDLPQRHEGCVRALTAESAAGTAMQHLLVIGLDEQSFPRGEAAPPLTGEAERQRRRVSGEMLLFTKLLCAASQTTTLSYPAIDDKAQKLNPSSYLAELQRLFAPGALHATQQTQVSSIKQLRSEAAAALLTGDDGPYSQLKTVDPEAALALAAGLRISYDRSHGDTFGPAEGVLPGDAAREYLNARYGPEHLWSASQLETYGQCPYKFYLRHVLHAEPLESLQLDVDYRRRGSLLHNAMVSFHRQLGELLPPGAATTSIEPEAFHAAFREAVEQARQALATAPHEAAVAEVEAMQATAWDVVYHRQHEKYDSKNITFDEPLRPTHYEARFGPDVTEETIERDALSTSTPFPLELVDEVILLTGQVDRIDVGRVAGQLVFSVIDYKTAKQFSIKQEDIESGRLLQLVLYTIAVSDHLLAGQHAMPWRSGYWLVQNAGFKTGKPQPGEIEEGVVVTTPEWTEMVTAVRGAVQSIVRNVRDARFPMFNVDLDCGGRCEFRTVCRVAQARHLDKLPEAPRQEEGS